MKKNKLQSLLSFCLASYLLASCSAYFDSSVPDELEILERKKSVVLSGLVTGLAGLSVWILSNMSFNFDDAF